MNSPKSTVVRLSSVTLLALIVVALPLPAFSQSCALCYTQAAASTQRFIQALRSGILILVIPPMFMSVGITVMAYRRRFRYKNEPDGGKSGW